MTFAVYVPPHEDGARLPVVWYLSGLTCTHANVTEKGEYRRACAELGLIFVALILLWVFGSVVAAAMPLIVGVLSIAGSLSLLAILAQFQQVNVFAQAVVTLLGLGLAIDYGLFMVSRFREELDKGRSTEEAVATTVELLWGGLSHVPLQAQRRAQ